ncbi:reverse transcriptase domain-containing protein [Tanacetum coccineum]
MGDQRTMAELLQPPTVGYGDEIVIPAILTENFELKHGLLNLVTSKQFCGFEKEDPHAHIRWFNKITSTIKYKDVPNASINLMLFWFSIEGAAWISLKKEPPRSILTWEDLVSMFINQFFPPSKTTNLRNEITNFQQRFDESFYVVALTDAVKALLLKNTTPPPASVKAVEESCVTCGGPHPYYQCLATDGNAFPGYQDNVQTYVSTTAINYNQGNAGHRPPSVAHQATMLQQNNKLENMLSNYFQMNKPSGSGSLPSNTVVNPKGDLKAITTRSGVSYDGPPIPPPFSPYPKVVEREPEVTRDLVQPSTKKVQPPDDQTQAPTFEPVNAPKPKPNLPYPSRLNSQKLRDRNDHQMMKFLQIFRSLHFDLSFSDALLHMPKFASTFKNFLSNKEKLFELANTPVNENCLAVILKKLPEKLGDPGKFLIPCNFPEIVECLPLADLGASINLMPLSIWRKLSLPELTHTQMILELADRSTTRPTGIVEDVFGGDFIIKEIKAYLASDSVPPGIEDVKFDPEGDIRLIEEMLNNDPYSPLPSKDLKCEELKSVKSSVDEPPELELKDLPSHLEYAFLEGTNKLPVIIAKNLKDEEKERLIKVLKSHKQAIAWKLSDIKGIDPQFCTHKILMEDDFKPAVQHQRRVNPKIHEVIKKEVVKLLDAGLIYPISDSPWVSPVHCVPKKGGMTVVTNEDNELIPTRLVTGWRVCIDYRKLNDATRKDHFPLPFMDQMLERLAGNEYYCFLDGFSGYFQIPHTHPTPNPPNITLKPLPPKPPLHDLPNPS